MICAPSVRRAGHAKRARVLATIAKTIALAAIAVSLSACATTPLAELLVRAAPSFAPLEPISSRDLRGRHLSRPGESMQVAPELCFRGVPAAESFASFQEYAHSYAEGYSVGGELARDFGDAIGLAAGIAAEGGQTFRGTIALQNIEEFALQSLYFDPSSVCAQANNAKAGFPEKGRSFHVVTRMLKADQIRATSADGSHLRLALQLTEFGGKLARETQSESVWSGAQIFFAAAAQRMRVQLRESQATGGLRKPIALNEAGGCALTLQAYSPVRRVWNGVFDCPGGERFTIRNQAANRWASVALKQGGVSFGIKTGPAAGQPGLFEVHLQRWTVVKE